MMARVSSDSSSLPLGWLVSAVSALMPTLITSLLHTRLATSVLTWVSNPAASSARRSGSSFSFLPSAMQMCVGPFPGVADAARSEERGALRGDARRRARRIRNGRLRIASLPSPFCRVSTMASFRSAGRELRGRLLGGRGLHEDDEHVGAFRRPRVGACPRAGHGDHRPLPHPRWPARPPTIFSTCSLKMS